MTAIQAKTFDQEQLCEIIKNLGGRFMLNSKQGQLEAGGTDGSVPPLHDRINWRRQHYYNLPEADPVLPEPWNRAARKYQTDVLRQKGVELKARLNENLFRIEAEAIPDTASVRDIAERAKGILNAGFEKNGLGQRLQSALSDGQIIDGPAILHWRLAADVWPSMPDFEWTDELPKDPAERKRFHPRKKLVNENGPAEGPRQYRETTVSLANRRSIQKARAGFPWLVQVLDATTCYWVLDQSPGNNPAMMLHIESVGLLDYATTVKKTDKIYVSLNQQDKKVRVYTEEPAPNFTTPSGIVWGDRVNIARLWTRDEYYELVSEGTADAGVNLAGGWELVKSAKHPYGMPPFAIVAGFEMNHADPALRYQPALAGMYAIKPYYDAGHAYLDVLLESTAVAMYIMEQVGTGQPLLKEDGSPVILTADAAAATELPPGYKLVEYRAEIGQGYVNSIENKKVELHDAAPGTGAITQLGANPRPWALRIMLQMANIGPVHMIDNQMRGLQTMIENMRLVMGKPVEEGGLGEALALQVKDSKGNQIRQVDPEEWEQIQLTARINTVSATERVTLEEHGRELADDPLFPLTLERLGDDYMGWDDTQERITEWEAETIYRQYFQPAVQRYVTAKWAGVQFVMGPNGQDIAMNGQPASPEQIGQANGIAAMPPTTRRRIGPGAPQGSAAGMVNPGAGPGPLAPLAGAPNQAPLQGIPG